MSPRSTQRWRCAHVGRWPEERGLKHMCIRGTIFRGWMAGFVALLLAPFALAVDTVSLNPLSCCDGTFVTTNAGGQTVWQNTGSSAYMYFDVPGTFTFTSGVPVFVRVVYFDSAFG